MYRKSIWGLVIGTASLTAAAAFGAPVPTAGNPVKGKAIFARCAACHRIDPAAQGGIGPNLSRVYRRASGQLAGYTYSPAMKAAHLKWDEATLSRFLAGPAKVVPGTKMTAPPIANAKDRADVIAYLKTAAGEAK